MSAGIHKCIFGAEMKCFAARERQLEESVTLLQDRGQGTDIVLGGDLNWLKVMLVHVSGSFLLQVKVTLALWTS